MFLIPTCTCAICNNTVTKRQTMYHPTYGRICPEHPEAVEYKKRLEQVEVEKKEALKREEERKQCNQDIDDTLKTFSFSALIRVEAFKVGVPSMIAYDFFKDRIPERIRERVLAEIKKQGDMTDEEAQSSIMSYVLMQERLKGEPT